MVKGSIRGDLCLEREARQKAEAENAKLRDMLENISAGFQPCTENNTNKSSNDYL